MKHNSCICIDAGTANCPCPLAETGDCLVCSRLAGRDKCDCNWCGLCIYNEFIQNDKASVEIRTRFEAPILSRKWYSSDLIMLEIKVDRSFALSGMRPGSFVFLSGSPDVFYDTPVSIMRTDVKSGVMTFAIKIISAKTKAIAKAEKSVFVRGVYRNGLLGEGLNEEIERRKNVRDDMSDVKWLFITKGVGFAPAVNIIDRIPPEVSVDMVIDTEKVTEEIVSDNLSKCEAVRNGHVKIDVLPLNRILDRVDEAASRCISSMEDYDKIFMLTSDYYVDTLTAFFNVPKSKLIYANNFHMCCGEGICGACCHIDENGVATKMCKCRKK